MNTRSPFLALMKCEYYHFYLGSGHPLGSASQLIMVGWNLAPALMLCFQSGRWNLQVQLFVWAAFVMLSWLTALSIECSTALLREVGEIGGLSPAKSNPLFHEFLSSRAIDRALHFRAKSAMLALVLVLPLLLNSMLIALVTGKFTPDMAGFLKLPPEELFVSATGNSVAVLAYTLLWTSAAALVSAQAYFGLASKLFSGRRVPRVIVMAGFPLLSGSLAARYLLMPDELARSAQFFAAHWLVLTLVLLAVVLPVQRFCERRFAEQEVL